MKNLKRSLTSVVKGLNTLSQKVDTLIEAVEKEEVKSTPAKAAKKLAKVAPKAAKSTAKNVPAKAAAKKTKAPQTDSDKVFQIIKRHKKGVGVAKLRDKTGFNDKKISNIIHRAFKGGVIKRVGRGLYMAV